jgi:hypothetical protein
MMDAKTAIDTILHNAAGNQTSGRETLVQAKSSILDPEVAATLKEQWKSAGRDNALVVMRLSEADGSNNHFVTGWDGKNTFVCMTESGLTYVDYRHLEKLKTDRDWNPETRLIEIRSPLLRENMERTDIDMLLDRIKKTLTKSCKKRRKGRIRNMDKFFDFAVVESDTNAEKAAKSGPSSETEFVKVDEKDDRIPKAPEAARTSKLPKGKTESFGWSRKDRSGHTVRRGINHPMMRMENETDPELDDREQVDVNSEGGGGSCAATPGGNKTDAQLNGREQIDVRHESNQTNPQLDRRTLVRMAKEGGGGGCAATPGGNKTDPQGKFRELVRMNRESGGSAVRNESKLQGACDSSDDSDDPDYTTYSGEKAKVKEFSARPKITVRHESLKVKKSARKLFGPNTQKKAPKSNKNLLVMILLDKGKGKGKAPKLPMSEAVHTCTGCGKSFTSGDSKPWEVLSGLPSRCASCEARRAQTGGGLKTKVELDRGPKPAKPYSPPKSTFESRYARTQLNLAEGKKALPPSFLKNIEKMKAKARARREASSDLDQA